MSKNNIDHKIDETRVWCDGCYDMVHFGHANFFRQAKSLGDKLVVGIHTDEDIMKNKGPPVFTEEERFKMVDGIKWVDEIVKGAPYVTSIETLDKYDCKFCVHGNDVTMTADGLDTYHIVKGANRYKEVGRTAGVSTTNLVERILLIGKKSQYLEESSREDLDLSKIKNGPSVAKSPWTGNSPFLLTTQKIIQFGNGKPAKFDDKIIYVDGAFDFFHVGHLDFLKEARKHGNYLIVGLHDDQTVKMYEGSSYPILNLNERTLSVLACKYVDEVVIGAPFIVNEDLIEHLKVNVVCHGQTPVRSLNSITDPYAIPKSKGIFKIIHSGNIMTTEKIVERVCQNRLKYEKRNQKKEMKEQKVYAAFQELKLVKNNV